MEISMPCIVAKAACDVMTVAARQGSGGGGLGLVGFIALVMFAGSVLAVEPNYVKTTVKNVDGSGVHDFVRTKYTDGLGRGIQSRVDLSGGKCLVSGTYYDEAGRVSKQVKPFVFDPGSFGACTEGSNHSGTVGNYIDMANDALINMANCYFDGIGGRPQDDGYPYSQTEYYADPLGRVKAAGAPGAAFSLDQDHHVKTWQFGTQIGNAGGDYDNTGFLAWSGLNKLIAVAPSDPAEPSSFAPDHFLTVSKDPNGSFSQTITDIFERTRFSWAHPDLSSPPIIAEYKYDILGNTRQEIPPEANLASTKYSYNTLGQLMKKQTPDAGVTKYKYDRAGNLCFVESEKLREQHGGHGWLLYAYDKLGRNTETGVLIHPNAHFEIAEPGDDLSDFMDHHYSVKVRRFYDDIDIADISAYNLPVSASELDLLGNQRGRLAAEIAWDESGRFAVADFYGYDNEGRVDTLLKVIPGMALHKKVFEYDIHGKITYYKYIYDGVDKISFAYIYDAHGRLHQMYQSPESTPSLLAAYRYSDIGLLIEKEVFSADDATIALQTIKQTYTIRDWLKGKNAVNGGGSTTYEMALLYGPELGAGGQQFNGNIEDIEMTYNNGASAEHFSMLYTYDKVNRLIRVDQSDQSLDETFRYDKAGRIIKKRKGDINFSGFYENYQYNGGTNQLTRIENHEFKGGPNTFIYDPDGNMVVDRSKNMVIDYDWRGLPVAFRFYNQLPAGLNWRSIREHMLDTNHENVDMLSKVTMLYDAGGNRVYKIERQIEQ